jgi:hypothetical protein
MVGGAARQADQTAERGAVDDSPEPWVRIWASSCFMLAQMPRKLIAFTRSKTSAGSSAASVAGDWMPALL